MNSKTYTLPNGKKAVFEYDVCGIGKVTLECMDELMAMIADRPQGEWIRHENPRYSYDREQGNINAGVHYTCSECNHISWTYNYCPNCGAKMRGADDDSKRNL